MSYAGPPRSRTTRDVPPPTAARPTRPRTTVAPGRAETDWQPVAVFLSGLALGIALGAGVAMLTAPQSGIETRADIVRKASRARRVLGRRSHEAWLDLRDDLRGATTSLRRRKAKRAAARAIEREMAQQAELHPD